MLIAGLFALSFSLAMGQAGMLSFGHSAYYGLGAFATLHVMKAVEAARAGVADSAVAARRRARPACSSGSCSAGWPRSGPASISRWSRSRWPSCCSRSRPPGRRCSAGSPASPRCGCRRWAINFATDTEVYYLTLVWVMISTVVPVGVHADADGAPGARGARERAPRALSRLQHPRRPHAWSSPSRPCSPAWPAALLAIANEATNYTIFGTSASANVVLQTFIGGAGTFFGPALGAADHDVLRAGRRPT